jgi:prepilin-type N-terminal cleavage/methylation domain-containing protein
VDGTPLVGRGRGLQRESSGRCSGFTLFELLIVLVISAIILTMGGLAFSGFFQRSSARRAASLFQQDLAAARSYAIRSREPVVLRLYESGLWYQVESQQTETEVLRRRFGPGGDIELTGVTLNTQGDSIVFTSRGMANFTPAGGGLGEATFSSGLTTYTVSFNGMGASQIDQT